MKRTQGNQSEQQTPKKLNQISKGQIIKYSTLSKTAPNKKEKTSSSLPKLKIVYIYFL